MGRFPSGQRGQTVNLLAMPSVVRIHHYPLSLISGKEFIGNASKYSTNRFCSRSCANTRPNVSEETKRKISISVKENHKKFSEKRKISYTNIKELNQKNYYNHPKFCKSCGKVNCRIICKIN